MQRIPYIALAFALMLWLPSGDAETVTTTSEVANPIDVVIKTSMGDITLRLDTERAPKTVENFLGYVAQDFYDGTIFHRVIDGFMIQGGGFATDYQQKPTGDPVANEADNGLKNDTGTIAMARTQDPHSATAQFFINVTDNAFLNHTAPDINGWGYAVFGEVTSGMETVDRIKAVPVGAVGPFRQDAPLEQVVILGIDVVD